MLSKRVVGSLDFCSPFKFVVVSRPQPRSSISPGARDERKQGAVRPVQRVRGFLNGQYTSLGTSCSPAPGGNQWKRALLVDKSVSRSIILHKRGYIFATVEIFAQGFRVFPLRTRGHPAPPLSLEELRKKKKKEKKRKKWIRHSPHASFLLRNRDETVEGRINFVRSAETVCFARNSILHARDFPFAIFLFQTRVNTSYANRSIRCNGYRQRILRLRKRKKKKKGGKEKNARECGQIAQLFYEA